MYKLFFFGAVNDDDEFGYNLIINVFNVKTMITILAIVNAQ